MKSTKSKIMIVMCVALLVMAVGYAAFSTVLTITGTANIASEWKVVFTDITQVSKTDGVTVKTAPSASGTTATFDVGLTSPGDKIVYKITLANQGTIDAIITNIEASATDSPAIIFTIDGVNIGDELDSKTSKEFTVTIEYDPHVTSQPDKLQKTLTVSIVTVQKVNQNIDSSTPSVDQPTYLSSAILRDNVAYADTNIDFSKTSEETGTNGLYFTSTNTENNLTTYYFRGAVENNYVKMGKRDGCGYKGQAVVYMIDPTVPEATIYPTEEQCLSTYVCDAGTIIKETYGMDYRYVNGIDAATCTYLGGTLLTEKATYGNDTIDIIWRIVRINEDRSVRIVTQQSIKWGVFNENDNDNAHVGYMYGATGQSGSNAYNLTHTNDNSSTIKTYLDEWYLNESNLNSYSSYLADAGFCNDRSLYSGAGYGTNYTVYGAVGRLVNINNGPANLTAKENAQPQFACPNEERDLFTTSSAVKGNKALAYPIGLLTADEFAYAGGVYGTSNTSMYLNFQFFRTISPLYYASGSAFEFVADRGKLLGGGSLVNSHVNGNSNVHPVINLQSGVEITGGDGTSENPYIIK